LQSILQGTPFGFQVCQYFQSMRVKGCGRNGLDKLSLRQPG
jgi:hypothetical protein